MLLLAASMLTACAVSQPSSSVAINLPALPAKFTQTTCSPATLPAKALTKAEVEKLWARDRATLVKCGYSLGGLTAFYLDLSRRFGAARTR